MDQDASQLWSWILDLTLAAYLHRDPDTQVRRMAKRYKRLCPKSNKKALSTLRTVIKASQPALVVKVAYDEFTKDVD